MRTIGDFFPPTIDGTVYIELTHKCNFKCKHCYANCPQPKEMTFEQVKHLSKILKKEGFKKILLTGGEPLLIKDIKKIINLLKNSKLREKLGRNAIKWSRNFSWEETSNKTMEILKKLK